MLRLLIVRISLGVFAVLGMSCAGGAAEVGKGAATQATTRPAREMVELRRRGDVFGFHMAPKLPVGFDALGGHIDPVRKGPWAPVMIPREAVNLAKGRAVTSSVGPKAGKLEQITDGEYRVFDGKEIVELGGGVQWVQIDLGKPCEVWAVVVWHKHRDSVERVLIYKSVVVRVADDEQFRDGRTIFNNDYDDAVGLGKGRDLLYMEELMGHGKAIEGKCVVGRYVRLYSGGNTSDEGNHYVEVEVWGVAAGG